MLVVAIFDNIGTVEMMIVAVAALLLFGKRLPEVASQAGATLTKFRRGLDSAIQDSGVEQELRKIKSAMPDMSVKDVARVAARRLEDRLRETIETTDTPNQAAGVPEPSTEADPAPAASANDAASIPSKPEPASDSTIEPDRGSKNPSIASATSGPGASSQAGPTSSSRTQPSSESSTSPNSEYHVSPNSELEAGSKPDPNGQRRPEGDSPPGAARTAKSGIDPAAHFGPPGTVPRE